MKISNDFINSCLTNRKTYKVCMTNSPWQHFVITFSRGGGGGAGGGGDDFPEGGGAILSFTCSGLCTAYECLGDARLFQGKQKYHNKILQEQPLSETIY